MYNPSAFRVLNRGMIIDFIRKNSLGIVFSSYNGEYYSSHIPFLVDDSCTTLTGHMAKANPHWTVLERNEVLVVFQGLNHYISPTWYNERGAVPTWNYVTVHIKGSVTLVSGSEGKMTIVDNLTEFFEPLYGWKWKPDWEDRSMLEMLDAIVGFQVHIYEVEGKWKMSQNHPIENRKSLIENLKTLNECSALQMASEIESQIEGALRSE